MVHAIILLFSSAMYTILNNVDDSFYYYYVILIYYNNNCRRKDYFRPTVIKFFMHLHLSTVTSSYSISDCPALSPCQRGTPFQKLNVDQNKERKEESGYMGLAILY